MTVRKRQFLTWSFMLSMVNFHCYLVYRLSSQWGLLLTTNISPLRSLFKANMYPFNWFKTDIKCRCHSTTKQLIFPICGQPTATTAETTILITFPMSARSRNILVELITLPQATQIIKCARMSVAEQSAVKRVRLK